MLLVSNEPGDSDVLLVSFELEQMLEEMDPRAHSPKVSEATVSPPATALKKSGVTVSA